MELISSKEINKCIKQNILSQIRKQQKASDREIYEDCQRNDDIICILCGGRYKRYQRSTHIGRKKHLRVLNEIYDKYID